MMMWGPHVATSAAWVARAIEFLGVGTPALVWRVDLIATPMREEQWRELLARLKSVLHRLPSGDNPICIRMRYAGPRGPVVVDIHLPLPDVAAGFIPLCGQPPPVGDWRIEPLRPGQIEVHRGGGPTVPPDFSQEIPF